MAIETGSINQLREPIITIRLSDDLFVDYVVDTGFSGGLMLPAETLKRAKISRVGKETVELVSGHFFIANIALVEIEWLSARRFVRVVISETHDALIGAELLDGNRLSIDYIANTVLLTDEAI